MSTKKKIQESETRKIYRSQINLNPYNPKTHSDKQIQNQRRNIEKVGYLGGIVWNETTGNLIDGHRRIKSLDISYKYDGTKETDYMVKVEVVQLDEKAEKEQMTFMALANTKADVNLIAAYAQDIDYSNIGLSDSDVAEIYSLITIDKTPEIETFDIDIPVELTEEEKAERKDKIKQVKQIQKEQSEQRGNDEMAYITISFSTYEAKESLCALLNINSDVKFLKGEELLEKLEL